MQKLILTSPKRLFDLAYKTAKWHFLYYLRGKSFPLVAGFYITNTCNFKCQMCNIWRNPKKDYIKIEDFKRIVDDLAEMGTYYLSLSGGETLLLPNLEEYLSYAKKKIPYVHFVTNGFLLDKERAKKIAKSKVDEVSISIDGLEKFHDQLRGVKGAFKHAITAINNLKTFAPKVKIVVNSVILTNNVNDLYKIIKITKDLGVLHKFQPLNQHELFANQKTKSKSWKVSESDIAKIKNLINFLKKDKHIANSRYFLSQIPNYFEGKTDYGIFSEQCLSPFIFCEFLQDGKMFPCLTAMNWKNGFDLKKGVKTVFKSKEYRQKQNQLKSCRLCRKNMYICYFEPRISFPIKNLIKYSLLNNA